jgi:drug/metabolite transporter (DMT)-like permease
MPIPVSTVQTGILWMVLSTACLAAGNSMVRQIATDIHPFQISFLTNLIILPFVAPQLFGGYASPDRREKWRLYGLITLVGGVSNLTWFYALAHVPLTKATAMTFAAPIIVTALAGVVFGERISRARWLAVLAGFGGVLVISRPGMVALDHGTAALMISTVSMAIMYMVSKRLTAIDSTSRIAAITTLIPVVTGFLPALVYWQTPSRDTILLLLLMAVGMFAGRYTLFLALRHAPASTVMPFDFGRLPFITIIAYLAYGQVPDAWAVLGALIIFSATFFIFREEQLKYRRALA